MPQCLFVLWTRFYSAGFAIFLLALSGKAAPNSPIPAAKVDAPVAGAAGKETAVFAGGCFWGTQAVFERLKGVAADHRRDIPAARPIPRLTGR